MPYRLYCRRTPGIAFCQALTPGIPAKGNTCCSCASRPCLALLLLRSACQLNNIAANGSREALRMKSTMMDFQLTLAPMLDRAAKLYPSVEIVSRMPDRSLQRCTYSDLATRARKLARALIAAGLQPAERVA